MALKNKMVKNILIILGFVISFIGGGSYGYHLADERIGKFIQKNAIENSIFHYKKASEIILALEQGKLDQAIKELSALKGSETVLFDSCLTDECPEYLRQKIESTVNP